MTDKKILFSVLVAALGYFVDVYDLIIFSVVRVQSLKDLGLSGEALTDTGVLLLNTQLAGMIIGGIAWGILGDKKGRLSILFGSILLYSLANIANAYVTTVPQYVICRFIAGLGLAGEIGAGITLVAELLPKEKRGLGTMFVATLGVIGGLIAATVGDMFDWKTAYITGGIMGLALLVLRIAVAESGLFLQLEKQAHVSRGSLRLLVTNRSCLTRFIWCTLSGLPIWFLVGLIITFSPEIGKNTGIDGEIKASGAVLYFYAGIVLGDLLSGLLSQVLKSRKKALWVFILGCFAATLVTLNLPVKTMDAYYLSCAVLGFFAGYWAVFLTVAAEHFGTNLRATVTTSAPNLVRGGAIILSSIFACIKDSLGVIPSLEIIAIGVFLLALVSVYHLRETFGVSLEYTEKT